MALPAARTPDEAQLYLDIHPCERCGSMETPWEQSAEVVDGTSVLRYRGTCAGCGTERDATFLTPKVHIVRGRDEVVRYGGAQPSELIDAGEWLAVADLAARSSGISVGEDEIEAEPEGVELLGIAAEAMTEVLKFVPDGADRVPDSAFWTTEGRQLHETSPGRFKRRRLLIVRDSYRDVLDRLDMQAFR
ncbi:MAG: hypothetical protein WCA46_01500 [Actinocatenispora sp.]